MSSAEKGDSNSETVALGLAPLLTEVVSVLSGYYFWIQFRILYCAPSLTSCPGSQ